MTPTETTTAEAVRDSILRQYYALEMPNGMLTDIIWTAGDMVGERLPKLEREQTAELEAHFIQRFHDTDTEPYDDIVAQAETWERELLKRTFTMWCEMPAGDAHWVGAQPVQRWAHSYAGSLECRYIQLCEECAREGWPPPEEDYTPEDCKSVFANHEFEFLGRVDPQFNQR